MLHRREGFAEFWCILVLLLATVSSLAIAVAPSSFLVVGPGGRTEFAAVIACDGLLLLDQCRDGEDPTIRAGEDLVVLGTGGSPIAIRRSNLCRRGNVDHLAVGSVGVCAGSAARTLVTLGLVLAIMTMCFVGTPVCLLLT